MATRARRQTVTKWSHISCTEKSHIHTLDVGVKDAELIMFFPNNGTCQTANDTHTHAHTHTPTHSAKQCPNTHTHSPPTQKYTRQRHAQRKAPKRKERRNWIVRWARESPPFFEILVQPTHVFFSVAILLPSPLRRVLQGIGSCPIYSRSLKRKWNVNMQMCYLEKNSSANRCFVRLSQLQHNSPSHNWWVTSIMQPIPVPMIEHVIHTSNEVNRYKKSCINVRNWHI